MTILRPYRLHLREAILCSHRYIAFVSVTMAWRGSGIEKS
jgi:hypothetical protein